MVESLSALNQQHRLENHNGLTVMQRFLSMIRRLRKCVEKDIADHESVAKGSATEISTAKGALQMGVNNWRAIRNLLLPDNCYNHHSVERQINSFTYWPSKMIVTVCINFVDNLRKISGKNAMKNLNEMPWALWWLVQALIPPLYCGESSKASPKNVFLVSKVRNIVILDARDLHRTNVKRVHIDDNKIVIDLFRTICSLDQWTDFRKQTREQLEGASIKQMYNIFTNGDDCYDQQCKTYTLTKKRHTDSYENNFILHWRCNPKHHSTSRSCCP